MSKRKVIYDVIDGDPIEMDLENAPLDALITLALGGDEEAVEAMAKKGLDLNKIFLESLEEIEKDTKDSGSKSEKNNEKGVE